MQSKGVTRISTTNKTQNSTLRQTDLPQVPTAQHHAAKAIDSPLRPIA